MLERFRGSILLLALMLLAACGGSNRQIPSQPSAAMVPSITVPTATTTPPTTIAATLAPTMAATVSTATPPTSVMIHATSRYGDLSQHTTADGYAALGNPDAPDTIVMFSDVF